MMASEPLTGSDLELAEELRERLLQSVKARLVADVPLGAFLSGGIDSSSVVALMASVSRFPVRTCSISFKDSGYDEREFAALASEHLGTDHVTEEFHPEETDPARLASVYDEPFADSSALPTLALCRMARRRVTVALSGDGGDEAFAGYMRYRWHLHEEVVRAMLPSGFRAPLFRAANHLFRLADGTYHFPRAKATIEALAMGSLDSYCQSVSITSQRLRSVMFSSDLLRTLGGYRALEVLRAHADAAPQKDALSVIQYIDLKTYLPGDILTKVDRASMAYSLEVRMPMLDHRLIEWAARLPRRSKFRKGAGKYILRQSMQPLLPGKVVERPKMGFGVPLASWLRGPLRKPLEEAITGRNLRNCGCFDVDAIHRLMVLHLDGSRDYATSLWSLLMFHLFLSRINS